MNPLLVKAIFAYLHYISIIGVFITLVIELILFKPKIPSSTARLIQKADGIYGLFAMLVLATGLIRVFYLEKGSEYYFSNYIFLAKFGLFIIVGILSIWPTLYFIKWKKDLQDGKEEIVTDESKYAKLKKMIHFEVALIFVIPLLAALMARGFGF